ncbi:anaerobic sulfite reductase subunit AsrA [Acidaminobacter sp. JC074]|nr:anaerobic sulfite reductase subunit AsrA [Acidaminobacter sp. JC074]MCH4888910.1 anaerobic sulfite reductase subunit AsrA [Acidaminobacter sp. JC074]
MTYDAFDKALKLLQDNYTLIGPVRKSKRGTMSDTDSIRYEEVTKFEQIEFEEKAQFSAKEILQPITQVLFYFTEDEYKVPTAGQKQILLFLRACDVHALDRVDQIYLDNGPVDPYYKQIRERVKVALIGCQHSYRNCFCVSMGTNKTDQYAIGVKPTDDGAYLDIQDSDLLEAFAGFDQDQNIVFEMDFVTTNETIVDVPKALDGQDVAQQDLWREYDSRCVACGKCNFVCPSCTCFGMQDIFYKDNDNTGERRRVWTSCHVDGYTDMAGGSGFRKKHGDRMRFKTLHKVHDYNKRFGKHMCVGCGRCDDACPEYISFSSCVNKLSAIEKEGK